MIPAARPTWARRSSIMPLALRPTPRARRGAAPNPRNEPADDSAEELPREGGPRDDDDQPPRRRAHHEIQADESEEDGSEEAERDGRDGLPDLGTTPSRGASG